METEDATFLSRVTPKTQARRASGISEAIAHGAGSIEYDIDPIVHGGSKLTEAIETRAKALYDTLHGVRLKPNKRTAYEDAFEHHEGPMLFLASMRQKVLPGDGGDGGGDGGDGAVAPDAKRARLADSGSELDSPRFAGHCNGNDIDDARFADQPRAARPKPALVRLQCPVQQYAWGLRGAASRCGALKAAAEPAFAVEEDKPYAELWMGTHPNGPALLGSGADGEPAADDAAPGGALGGWIAQRPELVSAAPVWRELARAGSLPYLFKVLSIRDCLSIQAHPDKRLAGQLHAENPNAYKDDNHKPEMCVALTAMEAMGGFRDLATIRLHLDLYPEFAAILSAHALELLTADAADHGVATREKPPPAVDPRADLLACAAAREAPDDATRGALREMLKSFVTADDELVGAQLGALLARVRAAERRPSASQRALHALIGRLGAQFPGDRGAMAPLFLNVIQLQPGEAFFMAANEPHAYISGECIEAMACSDNVVRLGLTPKFKDVPTLCAMLTYTAGNPVIVNGKKIDSCTRLYTPPVPEFEVSLTELRPKMPYRYAQVQSASLVLVLEGDGHIELNAGSRKQHASKGAVFFVSAGAQTNVTAGPSGMRLTRCHTNQKPGYN